MDYVVSAVHLGFLQLYKLQSDIFNREMGSTKSEPFSGFNKVSIKPNFLHKGPDSEGP